MIKLSDYIFNFIAGLGVKHVFLLSGGGAMHLVDSLGRNKDIEYICCLHEQTASIAASAHAMYTNNIGVALVTTGPGGTNAITGAAAAWLDSVPVIFISGQVKRADMSGDSGVRMLGFQEIDIVSLVKPITKYAVTVTEPSEIRYHLEKALYKAKSNRPGPVWLDIPLDIQASLIDEKTLRSFNNEDEIKRQDPQTDIFSKTKTVMEMINASERPVILAGCGIKLSNSQKDFISMINTLQVPTLTTWKASDIIDEKHDLFCGRPGAIGQRGANFIQQNADLIITIGARLDFGQIGYSYQNFARGAKKVIIDIDQAEINKLKFDIALQVCYSADYFIKSINKQLESFTLKSHKNWLKKCKQLYKKYPVILQSHWEQKNYTSTYALMDVLSDEMTSEDLLVPGSSGACAEISLQAFRVKLGQRLINMPGLGAMGFGLPCAIGACLASNRKRTINLNGDGGFQLNIQDLETVSRLNLPIKYFILNNEGYGSIKNTQRNYFGGFYVASDKSSGMTLPDIKKIAYAFNIHSIQISSNNELKDKVTEALNFPGPVICEVMIDPEEPTSPRMTSFVKEDGSIVSKPLEDLWPFLEREEFKSNMIIEPLKE